MGFISRKNRRFFEACGRLGGFERALRLAPAKRTAIASKAAKARWGKGYASIRLHNPRLEEAVFLEELLSEGSLSQWEQIYRKIADQPFGPTAEALEKVLSSTEIYGVTPLWKGILRTLRGSLP